MNALSALGGATRYEFAMQVRRRAVWIAYFLFAILYVAVLNSYADRVGVRELPTSPALTRADVVIFSTTFVSLLLVLGGGLLLADRTPRDRSTRVRELLQTTPAPIWTRLAGKYLGSVLGTLVPIFVVYAVGIGVLVARWGDASVIPLALAAFVALVVPPLCFVGAFTISLTNVIWSPLYMFLFVGYMLWTNLNPGQAIPTLNGTLLSPQENFVVTGFFHYRTYYPQDQAFYPTPSVALGIANIAVLLTCAAVALVAAWAWQRARAERQ